MAGKRYDKSPMTGKGNFDIHNVHSCHVETVVLLHGGKDDGHIEVDLNVEKLEDKLEASI